MRLFIAIVLIAILDHVGVHISKIALIIPLLLLLCLDLVSIGNKGKKIK